MENMPSKCDPLYLTQSIQSMSYIVFFYIYERFNHSILAINLIQSFAMVAIRNNR
jgi:hypothetical protein